ncbi:MAG: energy transducer TonB [Candidatus Acidiferrum sp.]
MDILPVGFPRNSKDSSPFWLRHALENLQRALRETEDQPSTTNSAQPHFVFVDLAGRNGGAQTFSAGAHLLLLALLLFALASVPNSGSFRQPIPLGFGNKFLSYVPAPRLDSTGHPSLGSNGGGGEHDVRPARFGNLAPWSSMPLAPPRLVHNSDVALPVPPAVYDANAPASVITVTHLGLPWMNSDTDSAGPGDGLGFGDGDGNTMGDGDSNGAGDGHDHGSYANVASPVACLYCPPPGYTEEARKAKLQGKMTLEVLVGADGKAVRVQILQGLGMGLDERAMEAVRGWRFSPGRDASKHPVPAWVTIETRFQLF